MALLGKVKASDKEGPSVAEASQAAVDNRHYLLGCVRKHGELKTVDLHGLYCVTL